DHERPHRRHRPAARAARRLGKGDAARAAGDAAFRVAALRDAPFRRRSRRDEALMFSQFFIRRPIVACVISILIVLMWAVSSPTLPVAQYPQIAPPVIRVTTVYPGASAQVVADSVAAPIEQQVNGVDRMLYMESTSASDGSYTLNVTFEVGA